MDIGFHRLPDLFAQLGLPDDEAEVERFIERHRGLADEVRLEEAPCWTPAQARLLREGLLQDADWAEVIDQLNLALRRH